MTTLNKKKYVDFEGHEMFRMRIILSLLSTRPIRIQNIRWDSPNPGITESEASFLQLIELLTNGTKVEINETGTALRFRPGVIVGGGPHTHTCTGSKGIGWFLEALIHILPLAKKPTMLTFHGITNDPNNQSVDAIRTITLPILRHFNISDGVELRVKKRGAVPLGGGEVTFTCPITISIPPLSLLDEGKIKRVRGIAFSAKVSPHISNRVVESARGILNRFLPDVYIYTDHYKGEDSGLSPGYGVVLVAESTIDSVCLGAEVVADKHTSPEEVGVQAASLLCEQIRIGGCVDASNQSLVLVMMACASEDVSKVKMGQLTEYSVETLRLIKEMLGIKFKIKPEGNAVLLSCLGSGYSNVAKART
eukprot:c7316_g1_i2.p1 GENE.c7316_g1_i2~~c7316_g1_i2.p1  ORF type:complete len:364 (+),score=87.47 c7316_g1_i2:1254-2345(+)